MKIKMYEVREDEKKAIERVAEELGADVSISSNILTPQEAESLRGIDGVSILGRTTVNKELLDGLKKAGVGYVSTRTVGYNHMDVAYAAEVGIRLCNANYPPYGVAEFTIMLMLLALRKYKPAMWRQGVNDYSLSGLQGREIRNMTVGVMGTGKIGRAVIKDLGGFGCRILAYDPYPAEDLKNTVEYVDGDTLLRTSDIITLHIPLMESTRHMINREAIAKMKTGVVIINASRGELTDIEALTEGIETEKIGALAMDVFEDENGIYHESRINDIIRNRKMAYIRQFPNVVLTQHMAFYTDANTDSMVECGIRGIVEMKEKGSCASELHP
ncbi:MAG TPA: lactate dehydrogenase [Candidatus Enterocloster excrementipullorum]|uniref:Lactate dehydrogenase n=1 Tax=Candidatus Enterocloster excrementipullorum TaxID=2838559 RepID=A0A9D2N133_9FIRM|nr:lactate dehydrogenase [Candidatus Enterocloster excrementipullorum]